MKRISVTIDDVLAAARNLATEIQETHAGIKRQMRDLRDQVAGQNDTELSFIHLGSDEDDELSFVELGDDDDEDGELSFVDLR